MAPPVALGTTMSSNDQKKFERFISLGPPKLSEAIGEDAYKFLIEYQ